MNTIRKRLKVHLENADEWDLEVCAEKLEHIIQTVEEHGDMPEGQRSFGLCNICRLHYLGTDLKNSLFEAWPLFTGEYDYPVPDPERVGCPEERYAEGSYNGDMYKGEYGNLRIQLAEFIIDKLRGEMRRRDNDR